MGIRPVMWVSLPYIIDNSKEIVLGKYEQDGIEENGKEPLEFVVVDAHDGELLLATKYAVDLKRYGIDLSGMNWEISELREWLNADFYNIAFTAIDKQKIIRRKNTTFHYADWNDKDIKTITTDDFVFALSNEEARQGFYKRKPETISVKPTNYLVQKIPEERKNVIYKYKDKDLEEYKIYDGNVSLYWLRDTASFAGENRAADVSYVNSGTWTMENDARGGSVSTEYAVRPAICIKGY